MTLLHARKFLLTLVVSFGWFCSAGLAQAATEPTAMVTRIVPETLDAEVFYPTNHATLAREPLQAYRWERVTIPQEWVDQGYYFEIWDGLNRPIPGYQAQRLTDVEQLQLNEIDATLYPQIRFVLFVPNEIPPPDYQQPIYFFYHQQADTTLFFFVGLITCLYGALVVGGFAYRIGFRDIAKGTQALFQRTPVHGTGHELVVYGWVTVAWSSVFGFTMSHFVGGVHMIYVFIKLPFLLLAALLMSALSLTVLSLLLGVQASVRAILVQATQLVATTALALASFSPVLLFFIYIPQNHDELLFSTILFFGAAGGLAAWRLWLWLTQQQARARAPVTLIWICLYGLVFLQLGWLMRPWIGVIDNVQNTVPFARTQGGNVFVELQHATNRL